MRGTLIAIAILLTGCSNGSPATEPSLSIEGNFLSSTQSRIYTVSVRSGTKPETVAQHARSLPFTIGQVTAAYYYPEETVIPCDDITLAASYNLANEVIYDNPAMGKWRFAYMRSFAGSDPTFVDCQSEPGHDLCRR